MKVPWLKKEQDGPNSLTQMDNNEVGYGSTSQPQETRDFSKEFYGVQKVILMKRLGRKWDKILVVTGYVFIIKQNNKSLIVKSVLFWLHGPRIGKETLSSLHLWPSPVISNPSISLLLLVLFFILFKLSYCQCMQSFLI